MQKIIIIIILIIIIIIIGYWFNNTENFKVDENIKINDVYPISNYNIIDNVNIVNNNKNIYIIPKYVSNNTIKLIIINFNNERHKDIYININNIEKKIKLLSKYFVIDITDKYFNFQQKNEKNEKNINIPRRICQTGKNINVSYDKYLSIKTIIDNNPNYEYNYFDNNRAKKFIEKFFDKNVLKAYDKLIPGAYKADLFRYCYLYINGGIYVDCKMICLLNFDELFDKEYDIILVQDIGPKAYWNGFICAKPSLKIFKDCIDQIVENVNNKYYGNSALEITGPELFFKKGNIHLIDLKYKILKFYHINHGHVDNCIIDNGKKILKVSYPTYYEENDYINVNHYSKFWHEKKVYKIDE